MIYSLKPVSLNSKEITSHFEFGDIDSDFTVSNKPYIKALF